MWLKQLLLVLAVAHLILGGFVLYAPDQAAGLLSMDLLTAGARGEMRAAFGGLVVAIGLAILRGSRGGPLGRQWLLAVALGFCGLLGGRIVSLALDGLSAHTVLGAVFEAAVAGILLYSARELREGPTPASAVAPPKAASSTDWR